MPKLFVLFISWIFLLIPQSWATSPIELSSSFTEANLDSLVDSWEKRDNESAREFLNATPESSGHTKFGYVDKPIWLRFALRNPAKEAKHLVLTIDPPLIDELSLTVVNQDGKVIQTAGFNLQDRFNAGALFRRRPAFEITAQPQAVITVIMRIMTTHSLDLHLNLATSEIESVSSLKDNLAMGAYYGIFFIILVLNLLVYVATWDRLYLSYVGFLLALGMQLTCLNGFLDFSFDTDFIFARHLCTMSAAALFFAHLFCREFLQTRMTAPLIDKAQLGMMTIAGLIGALHVTPLYQKYSILLGHSIDLAIGVSMLLIIASTIAAFRRGYQPAIFFLIAWGSFLGLISLYFSATYGLVQGGPFTQYAVQIGSTVEMILLSIALGYRIYCLKKAKIEAEEKAREAENLRRLIHVICHDLRNPLTVISGLAESYLHRGQKEWAPIARAVKSQQEILDFVRLKEAIDTGKHRLQMVPVRIEEAAEKARFVFEGKMQEKKLQWHSSIDTECVALADPTLLSHTVIANLISNAIKFTPEGGRIDFTAHSSGKQVVIEIRDNGIGIPAKLRPHLFSNQTPTTRPGTHGEKGNGFGLPLVKAVVESFGGTLSIQSLCKDEARKDEIPGTRIALTLQRGGQNLKTSKNEVADLQHYA